MKNSAEPLVSIIVNCFNGEKYLKQALDSILAQTYRNWEVIFWDNRSNDNSADIFKNYKDERFKYFYAPQHTFLFEARNEAIKIASGEFIAFLDVGDWWEKNKLELQIPLFDNTDIGVVYGNHFLVNQNLNIKRIFARKKLPRGFILDELLQSYVAGIITVVIRKNFMDNLTSAFNNQFHIIGDFDLIVRMSTKCEFDCIQKPVAYHRARQKNESLLNKNRHIKELKTWYQEMLNSPIISKSVNFNNIINIINFIEITNFIEKSDYKNAKLLINKMPFSFKKIKFLIALILPNNFVKKFIEY